MSLITSKRKRKKSGSPAPRLGAMLRLQTRGYSPPAQSWNWKKRRHTSQETEFRPSGGRHTLIFPWVVSASKSGAAVMALLSVYAQRLFPGSDGDSLDPSRRLPIVMYLDSFMNEIWWAGPIRRHLVAKCSIYSLSPPETRTRTRSNCTNNDPHSASAQHAIGDNGGGRIRHAAEVVFLLYTIEEGRTRHSIALL